MCERSLAPAARPEREPIALPDVARIRDAAIPSLASGRAERVEVHGRRRGGSRGARLARATRARAAEPRLERDRGHARRRPCPSTASGRAAGEIRVSVRDEGRGIARRICRISCVRARTASGGSGFGTASVRACVRELGGRLESARDPRAGTEFVLRLPRGVAAGVGRAEWGATRRLRGRRASRRAGTRGSSARCSRRRCPSGTRLRTRVVRAVPESLGVHRVDHRDDAALALRAPCGSSARWETFAATKSIAAAFGQAATHAPQPMHAGGVHRALRVRPRHGQGVRLRRGARVRGDESRRPSGSGRRRCGRRRGP
jgi:hypothetical protein